MDIFECVWVGAKREQDIVLVAIGKTLRRADKKAVMCEDSQEVGMRRLRQQNIGSPDIGGGIR